jgi:uncharacterized protein (DUF1697 family)
MTDAVTAYPATTYAVLLRGINLGSHNRLSMADLRAVLERAGCTDVRTYLQSGNGVVGWAGSAEDLERAVAVELMAHGLPVPVLVRSAAELVSVVERNPWPGEELDPKLFHVGFLFADPDPELVAAVDGEALLPERFAVSDREAYLYYAGGVQRSRLDRVRLGVQMTARNWRTVLALRELASSQPD